MPTRGVTRRAGWVLADQALYSLTNFALTVLVARSVGVREFGAFSAIYLMTMFLVGITMALASEPLTVRFSAQAPGEVRTAAAAATGFSLVAGLLLSALAVALRPAVDGPIGAALVPFAVVLPGILVQDGWRYAFFAAARPRAAFANDLVWAVTQLVGVGLVVLFHEVTVSALVLAWGAGGTLAAAVGCVQAGTVPLPSEGAGWLRAQGDLSFRYMGEFIATSGSTQLTTFFVGAFAGLSQLAVLRAGLVIFGPLAVVFYGLRSSLVPEAVRLVRVAPGRLWRASKLASAAAATVAAGWGVAALLLPRRIGEALLGETWQLARSVLPAVAISKVAIGLTVGAFIALRGLALARQTFRLRLGVAVLSVGAGAVGGWVSGAQGAAWGLALANVIGAAAWWQQWRALRETSPGGTAGTPAPGDVIASHGSVESNGG